MKLFLESADPSEIRSYARRGSIAGVLLSAPRELLSGGSLLAEICGDFPGPVIAALGDDPAESVAGGLLGRARVLARVAPNVIVELPFGDEGMAALRACVPDGLRAHVTRCSTPVQALEAARAGAVYVSPTGARAGARPGDPAGPDLIRKIVAAAKTHRLAAEVLVVSARSAGELLDAAVAGAQNASVTVATLQKITEPTECG
jgi:transaldolase